MPIRAPSTAPKAQQKAIYIVDDDRDVRISTGMLLRTHGASARPFSSAADFLDELPHLPPGCILLDLRMPQLDGLGLLRMLRNDGCFWPVFLMTGHGDVAAAVSAMKLGATDFLEKPVMEADLLRAIEEGFALLSGGLEALESKASSTKKIARLTRRERQVLDGILAGKSNKEQALLLGLSPRTVEMHRASLMRNLGATTLSEALAIAVDAGLKPSAQR